MDRAQVLVIDDDRDLCALVCELLSRSGMVTIPAHDGVEGLQKFFSLQPSLVVLDVTMPGMNGFEALDRIRGLSDVPVLMLTAKATEVEKVHGLRSGADDYMTKPFGLEELVARAEALLRRVPGRGRDGSQVLSDSLVTIDFARASVTVDGHGVSLTPLEFKLLGAFVRHPNQTLSPDQLLDLVWGISGSSRDQVKVYVGYLRRKLKEAVSAEPIETVRGFGYRYQPHLN
jgi:DNA-binding response OmpR family regulator